MGFFRPVLHCVLKTFRYLQNKGTSLWNFFLNSGPGKFRHGVSIIEACYQLSSRKVDAQNVINLGRRRSTKSQIPLDGPDLRPLSETRVRDPVGSVQWNLALSWQYIRALALDRCNLSQRSLSSVYSTILSRVSVSDSWCLYCLLYTGWSDVTASMVTIRSPFCGYDTI